MFVKHFAYFFLTTHLCTLINGAEFSECEKQPVGSFVAVAYNCSKAIYCNGVDSTLVDCDNENPYFSAGDEMCHNNFSVCGNRPFFVENISTTTVLPTPNITTSTATTANGIKPNTKPTTTLSPLTVPTNATSTDTSTTYASSTTGISSSTWPPLVTTPTSTTATSSNNHPTISLKCPDIDNPSKPLFLPHPKYCSQFYLCYHGVAALMQCPNMLHFDVTQQTCNIAEKAKCQLHPVIPRELCLPHIVATYPHPTNCNYYYLCEFGFLMVMQCPFNMGWDYEKRICAMRSKAGCYKTLFTN